MTLRPHHVSDPNIDGPRCRAGSSCRAWGVFVGALASIVLLGLLGTVGAQPDAEDAIAVRVEGVASIITDVGVARDEATRDALRNAVEQALGVSISGRTVMIDLQVVEDRIVGRSEGFVRSYSVVGERRDGSLYRVTIDAVVDRRLMIDDLEGFGALLRSALGNPRILVVTSSGEPGGHVGLIERAVIDHLVERQFQVLSADQLAATRDVGGLRSALELANVARTVDADLVIRVIVDTDAVGSRSTASSDVHSVRANVSMQAILSGTSQIVASASGSVTRARASPRLAHDDAALAALAESLEGFTLATVSALNTALAPESTHRSVQVVIEGIHDFGAALALRDVLGDVRGVATLQQRQFGEGRATFDVQGNQTTDEIAVRLMAQDVVPVTVTYLDGQRVVFEVME